MTMPAFPQPSAPDPGAQPGPGPTAAAAAQGTAALATTPGVPAPASPVQGPAPVTPTTTGVAAPLSTAPPPAAAPVIDYAELARHLVGAGLQVPGAQPAPKAPPAKEVAETNRFEKGQMVRHDYVDPYDGRTHTRYGVVITTHPNEGGGARSSVAWLGDTSGPIGDEQLEGA